MRHGRVTYNVAEAARMLGVSPTKLYRLIRAGDLPAVTLGRRRVIPAVALERLLGAALDDDSYPDGPLSGSEYVNHVTLAGRVVNQPVVRASRTGTPYGTIRLAVRRKGETDVLFVQVVAFGPGSAVMGDLTIGQLVRVDGRLNQREWVADDGARRRTFRILGDRLSALEPGFRRTMAS